MEGAVQLGLGVVCQAGGHARAGSPRVRWYTLVAEILYLRQRTVGGASYLLVRILDLIILGAHRGLTRASLSPAASCSSADSSTDSVLIILISMQQKGAGEWKGAVQAHKADNELQKS